MSKTTLFALFYVFLLLYFYDIDSNCYFQAGHRSQEFVDSVWKKVLLCREYLSCSLGP